MPAQEFHARRSRATTKPSAQCPEPVFFSCGCCQRLLQQVGYEQGADQPECCGKQMERLAAKNLPEASENLSIDYKIVGGYNENAIQVFWEMKAETEQLSWVYLKTFTGGYMKYLTPGKKPPMVFALADEDAYAYCDEDPCIECTFRCKRGVLIYACINNNLLVEVPVNKMSAYWQS